MLRTIHKKSNILSSLGPLYHKYRFFGVENEQLPGIFKGNQKAKTPLITAYIAYALAMTLENNDKPTFAELFCADGYYGMVASRLGAELSVCYDDDSDPNKFFQKAPKIAKLLNLKNMKFLKEDMQNISKLPKYDIVANVGGLYHVSNPEQTLKRSYSMAKEFLIVQTVVSMESNDSNYFITPAPGQNWGSRYSRESFEKLIERLKYTVIDKHFNELKSNEATSSRGSLYYLIKK